MPLSEREITEPVDLAGPTGLLNPEAVGWTRTPLHRTDSVAQGLIGRTRTKRWEYWAITTPTHAVGLVVSDISYASTHGIFVLDRLTGEQISHDPDQLLRDYAQLQGEISELRDQLKAVLAEALERP